MNKSRLHDGARALGEHSHGWFRRWFRKVWQVRGGGLYALGFVVAFLIYEAQSIVEDFKQIHMLFDGEVINFFVNFFVDSLRNTIQAFIWPADVIRWYPPWSAVALGIAFFVFPLTLKKPLERWIFEGKPPPPDSDEKG